MKQKKVVTYPCQEVLLNVPAVRWDGLSYVPEKPDEEWKGFMEELSVFLSTTHAPFPIVGAKLYSLR